MPIEAALANAAFPNHTSYDIVALDNLRSAAVVQGVAYWNRIRSARPYPTRDELKVRDIPGLLKHMVLLKVIGNADDFLLKVVGDEVVRAYRAPLANRLLSNIGQELPATAQRWMKIYRQVAQTGLPVAVVITLGLEIPEVNFTHAEAVCLPFGAEGGPVDHLVTFGQHVARPGIARI